VTNCRSKVHIPSYRWIRWRRCKRWTSDIWP